jgi:hypothetical protein
MRRKQMVSAHGSYSRAESAKAQFKPLQNDEVDFLQNFCFYPGGCRDKIGKETEAQRSSNTKHFNESRRLFCGSGACPRRKPGIPAATIEAESLSHKKQHYRPIKGWPLWPA